MSTIKMKTSNLIGPALDYAVSVAEARRGALPDDFWLDEVKGGNFDPSGTWSEGGPIIERERIAVVWVEVSNKWMGYARGPFSSHKDKNYAPTSGSTPLIAAMRCFVASSLGEDVAIPEELLATNT